MESGRRGPALALTVPGCDPAIPRRTLCPKAPFLEVGYAVRKLSSKRGYMTPNTVANLNLIEQSLREMSYTAGPREIKEVAELFHQWLPEVFDLEKSECTIPHQDDLECSACGLSVDSYDVLCEECSAIANKEAIPLSDSLPEGALHS